MNAVSGKMKIGACWKIKQLCASLSFVVVIASSHNEHLDDLKGKLGDFFYRLKVFISPKLKEVSISNFHRKAPKWENNQAKW